MIGSRLSPLLVQHVRMGTVYRDFVIRVDPARTPVSDRVNDGARP